MRKDIPAAVCDAEVHECFANAIAGTRCIRAAKALRKQSDKCVGDRMDVVRRYDAGEFGIFEQLIGQVINCYRTPIALPFPSKVERRLLCL